MAPCQLSWRRVRWHGAVSGGMAPCQLSWRRVSWQGAVSVGMAACQVAWRRVSWLARQSLVARHGSGWHRGFRFNA
jgi:hypothetical protein